MNTLLYFAVMAAAFMGLPYVLPGVHVTGWVPAFVGAVILAVANTVVKPILFVLTLPFTIVTIGLFLLRRSGRSGARGRRPEPARVAVARCAPLCYHSGHGRRVLPWPWPRVRRRWAS